jgi:threonylcarbamoyladenosine tRNA methylthiotransferase MtaB
MSMRVRLETLGCRLNEAELQTWARQFRQRGFRIAGPDEPADLVVVNTCAVTGEAVRKSRQILRRARRGNPAARLVVSGCLVSLGEAPLPGGEAVDLLVDNRDKDRLVEIATDALGLPSRSADDADAAALLFARGRQRAFVKVQDGCRHRCTFCIVTVARGEERSRPVGEVVEEVNALVAGGVREVVLTGVHLGGYGSDTGGDLARLLRAVLADTDVERVRMGSLEPWDIPRGLWDLFGDPRLMPHLHLPMQSGSDAVLRRMARRCRTGDFAALVEAGRARVADLNVTTDVIVGFPGETDAEFRQTLAFVARIGCGHVHVFAYSARAGTKAAALPDQVDPGVRRARGRELQDLAAELKRDLLAAQAGRTFPVLLETRTRDGAAGEWLGYTPSYLPVRVATDTDEDLSGRVLDATVLGLHGDGEHLAGRVGSG